MKARGSNGVAVARPVARAGMTSCGCVCTTWYCSTNASSASFQFTGRRHAYHHSVRSDSTFHASRIVAAGSMHSPQRRGVVVEVDPRAAAPHLAPHRRRGRCRPAARLCSANVLPLRDAGVRAVEAVAPAVERAGEPARARPAALDDLDAAVAAGVLERAHAHVVGAHTMTDWSRISYSTKSCGCGISSSRHAICQTRGHSSSASICVEVRVEVALLGDPVGDAPSRRARASADHF